MQKHKFTTKLWKYPGKGGWCFVTLPKKLSTKVREKHGLDEEGWGRLKVVATVGQTSWNTSIWFDTKFQSYILPVKAQVRKKEGLKLEKKISVFFTVPDCLFHPTPKKD